MIIIPVLNEPSQSFDLILEGSEWTFRIAYNSLDALWYLGLDKDGVTLLNGIKIVSGINLLRAFNIMKGQIIAATGGDLERDPTMGDWGTNAELTYFSDEDINQIIANRNDTSIQ